MASDLELLGAHVFVHIMAALSMLHRSRLGCTGGFDEKLYLVRSVRGRIESTCRLEDQGGPRWILGVFPDSGTSGPLATGPTFVCLMHIIVRAGAYVFKARAATPGMLCCSTAAMPLRRSWCAHGAVFRAHASSLLGVRYLVAVRLHAVLQQAVAAACSAVRPTVRILVCCRQTEVAHACGDARAAWKLGVAGRHSFRLHAAVVGAGGLYGWCALRWLDPCTS